MNFIKGQIEEILTFKPKFKISYCMVFSMGMEVARPQKLLGHGV